MLPVPDVRGPASLTTGLFHCPACGGDRQFRLRHSRAWLPGGLGGRLRGRIRRRVPAERPVLCRDCGGRFSLAALDVPTAARLEELVWRGTRTAAAYVLTGLRAAPLAPAADDPARALATLRRVLGPDYGPEVLSADLAAHREGSDLGVLTQLAPHVSAPGREGLLRGLADLVLVLDRSGGPDWSRLGVVATALGVPPAQVRGIVDEAWSRAQE